MDIGAQLRTAREAMGLSISALAERTRVPARALAAIELNDQSSLPPHPFGRGFVRTYAEEVALDPERTVRQYFAQFPAPHAPARAPVAHDAAGPSWQPSATWGGMATAVAILLVVVAAAVVLGRRGDSAVETGTVGTSGATPAAPAAADDTKPTAAPHEAAPSLTATPPAASPPAPSSPPSSPTSSTPPAGAITVVLSMSRPCWVTATVDGRRAIYRVLQPGERPTLVAERGIAIRFGDAGAVAWTINGRDAGAPGTNGTVRDVNITPENAGSVR
jgi:cytoskeletal protein RodZ